MAELLLSTAQNRRFKMISSADHVSLRTLANPQVLILRSTDTAFAAPQGAVTEIGNGWYNVALTMNDTSVPGDLAFYITGSGADDTDFTDTVIGSTQTIQNSIGTIVNIPTFGRTFQDAWRKVKLHAPAAPALLAQFWVQQAYNRILESRGWSFLRKSAIIPTEAVRTVTCTVTLDSTIVTATPGTFLATDPDKQLRVSSFPIYTISTVAGDGSSCVLDQPWSDPTVPTGSASATILTAYFTAPSDFGRFLLVADPYNQRRLPFWITEEQLNILDPIRRASDPSPRMLVALRFSTTAGSAGRAVYELWPYTTAQRRYPYLYFRRPDTLQDATVFQGVFAQRPDLFTTGALIEAARWPGTGTEKNGYFNMSLADKLEKDFIKALQYLSVRDDDMYLNDYETVNWSRWPLAGGYDTHLLRSTDADINNYWAMN